MRRSGPTGGTEQQSRLEAGRKLDSRDRAITRACIERKFTGVNNHSARTLLQPVLEAVWERDNGECVRCGETGLYGGGQLDFYRIVLPEHGGQDDEENLRVLCQDCGQVIISEAQRVGTGIGQLKRIVPTDVDDEQLPYESPTRHVIGKRAWILGWLVIPAGITILVNRDASMTVFAIGGFLIGTFLIFLVIDWLSTFYDRIFNPEKVLADATYEAWRSRNIAWNQERRRIAHQAPGGRSRYIPSHVKEAVFERDGGRCVQCGSNINIHYDHDIPHSLGGSNTEENIRLLCSRCNQRKSNKIM